MKTKGCLETKNTNYQVTRRRKERNWRPEGEDLNAGKQKL